MIGVALTRQPGSMARGRRLGVCGELLEAIAGMHPDAPGVAQLLGSAAAVRERLNVPLLPIERAELEGRHADVRERHAESDFDRDFAAGRGLTRDDAIRGALALRPGLPQVEDSA